MQIACVLLVSRNLKQKGKDICSFRKLCPFSLQRIDQKTFIFWYELKLAFFHPFLVQCYKKHDQSWLERPWEEYWEDTVAHKIFYLKAWNQRCLISPYKTWKLAAASATWNWWKKKIDALLPTWKQTSTSNMPVIVEQESKLPQCKVSALQTMQVPTIFAMLSYSYSWLCHRSIRMEKKKYECIYIEYKNIQEQMISEMLKLQTWCYCIIWLLMPWKVKQNKKAVLPVKTRTIEDARADSTFKSVLRKTTRLPDIP